MISLLLSGFAHAEWTTQGSFRLSSDVLSEFDLDELGTPSGIGQQGLSRVRLSAVNQISDQLSWNIGLEVANGILWGDTTNVGDSVDTPFRPVRSDSSDLKLIWPTAFNIRYQSSAWFGTVGIQSFQWGLGLLSNHGNETPWFGDAYQGNHYLRASIGTPLAFDFQIFGAVDQILRDDAVSFYGQDSAQQMIVGLIQKKKTHAWGVLAGLRHQEDRPDSTHPLSPTSAQILPLDLFFKVPVAKWLLLEGEVAHLRGKSTRLYSEQTRGEPIAVRSTGALLRARTLPDKEQDTTTRGILELGFASGDANSTDDVARAFAMHSNHNNGLLLYDQILPLMAANSVDRLSDPGLSGKPAPGLNFAIPQGGITNSLYSLPIGELRHKGHLLRLGWMRAYSPAPLSDPYWSALQGGYPQSYGSSQENQINAEEQHLGDELLARIKLSQPVGATTFELRTDASLFLSGAALEPLLNDPTWMLHTTLNIIWGGQP